MKYWKHYLVIIIFIFTISCNGSGTNLGGIWEWKENTDDEYGTLIEFKGSKFTFVEYQATYMVFEPHGWEQELFVHLDFIDRNKIPFEEEEYIKYSYEDLIKISYEDLITAQWIKRFSKEEYDKSVGVGYIRGVRKGTFSISEDNIELIFSNGSIEVFSFSRTENTILIAGKRFIRK